MTANQIFTFVIKFYCKFMEEILQLELRFDHLPQGLDHWKLMLYAPVKIETNITVCTLAVLKIKALYLDIRDSYFANSLLSLLSAITGHTEEKQSQTISPPILLIVLLWCLHANNVKYLGIQVNSNLSWFSTIVGILMSNNQETFKAGKLNSSALSFQRLYSPVEFLAI